MARREAFGRPCRRVSRSSSGDICVMIWFWLKQGRSTRTVAQTTRRAAHGAVCSRLERCRDRQRARPDHLVSRRGITRTRRSRRGRVTRDGRAEKVLVDEPRREQGFDVLDGEIGIGAVLEREDQVAVGRHASQHLGNEPGKTRATGWMGDDSPERRQHAGKDDSLGCLPGSRLALVRPITTVAVTAARRPGGS